MIVQDVEILLFRSKIWLVVQQVVHLLVHFLLKIKRIVFAGGALVVRF
jgi:hypothetical protein